MKKRIIASITTLALIIIPMNTTYAAESGWRQEDTYWYYYNEDGYRLTGWIELGGKYYYLYPDGHCAINERTPDGYYVDGTGAFYTPQIMVMSTSLDLAYGYVPPQTMGINWERSGDNYSELKAQVEVLTGGKRTLVTRAERLDYIDTEKREVMYSFSMNGASQTYSLKLGTILNDDPYVGSLIAYYNYDVLRGILSQITAHPDAVANAIYDSWQGENIHGINRYTPVVIGDIALTFGIEDGQGVYTIYGAQ